MHKKLVLVLALLSGSAFAQDYFVDTQGRQAMEESGSQTAPMAAAGMRHMFEFNVDSIEAAAISFDKIKTKGSDADSGTNLDISLNYAYGIHRFFQAAARFEYFSGVNRTEEEENFNLALGLIANASEDFTNSAYASLYLGAGWAQQFGNDSSRDDLRFGTLAIGKRYPLEMLGLKHIVYSPEIALNMVNSTTDESLDYSYSLQFKFLQFSVFF